jgi:uroporphyrinogen-III decarboxylase
MTGKLKEVSGMTNKRIDLRSEEKQEKIFKKCFSPPGIAFESPEAEKAYHDRITRVKDVIQLRVPDRVPVYTSSGFFLAYYAGITPETAIYDYGKLGMAWKNFVMDFQPDVYAGSVTALPEKAFEMLDHKLYLWPSHAITPDTPYQYVEAEHMMADEYDALIQDPSDFLMRVYLPRIFGVLKPFERLSSLANTAEIAFVGPYLMRYAMPKVRSAFEALLVTRQEALKWRELVVACDKALNEAGFPILTGGSTKAPFDMLGGTLRGTKGIMIDMYRQPDKVLEALERLTPLMISMGVGGARASERPLVFIPLHKGADGFMSDEQFKRFYWPTLRKVILGLIAEGLVPFIFAEGVYNNSRLEIVKDIPRGKTIWLFDDTDMAKAKSVLGDTACIAGNVPISLLSTGKPDEVKAYCKKLIDVAGKDGGFIMASGAVIDQAKPENLRAMIEFTKEYGVYQC